MKLSEVYAGESEKLQIVLATDMEEEVTKQIQLIEHHLAKDLGPSMQKLLEQSRDELKTEIGKSKWKAERRARFEQGCVFLDKLRTESVAKEEIEDSK